jgi:acyl-CoA synthetase
VRPSLTLHHPAQARLQWKQGLWRDEEARPYAIALVDGERHLTWQALRYWVDGVAIELQAYGLIGGDRIAIWMSTRAEAIVSFLACSREGEAVDGNP